MCKPSLGDARNALDEIYNAPGSVEARLKQLFGAWKEGMRRPIRIEPHQFNWSTASMVAWLNAIDEARGWNEFPLQVKCWELAIASFVSDAGEVEAGLEITGLPWSPGDEVQAGRVYQPTQPRCDPEYLQEIVAAVQSVGNSQEVNVSEYMLGLGATLILMHDIVKLNSWSMFDGRNLYVGWSDGDFSEMAFRTTE